MYRDAAAFEVHLNGPSLTQLREEIAGMVMKLHGVRCTVVDEWPSPNRDNPTTAGGPP
jgi:hypothetical protein